MSVLTEEADDSDSGVELHDAGLEDRVGASRAREAREGQGGGNGLHGRGAEQRSAVQCRGECPSRQARVFMSWSSAVVRGPASSTAPRR